MSLLDEVRAYTTPRSQCQVSVVLAILPDDDAADLRVAVADPTITATAIERALKDRSIRLHEQSIRRHRRGACQCPA